jgi:hexosaminidase
MTARHYWRLCTCVCGACECVCVVSVCVCVCVCLRSLVCVTAESVGTHAVENMVGLGMLKCLLSLAVVAALTADVSVSASPVGSVAPKSYSCVSGICELQSPFGLSKDSNKQSQQACLLTCGGGSLWPYPTGAVAIQEDGISSIAKFGNNFVYNFDSPVLHAAVDSFYYSVQLTQYTQATKPNLSARSSIVSVASAGVGGVSYVVTVDVKDGDVDVFSFGVDESYSLVTKQSANSNVVTTTITANTVFGARHAIETLAQLVAWDSFANAYVVAHAVNIQNDTPQYQYRGVMLDLSRHFMYIEDIKKTVRAMSYNKMNVLHLHVSDTSSFPIILEKQPNISYHGAYSELFSYTIADIVDLANYANNYGVMIIPELDGPSHVAMGYQWGPYAGLGDLVICTDPTGAQQDAWASNGYEPASGQLNLANENIYSILADVHDEIIAAFEYSSIFHVGGDEIMVGSDQTTISCYNSTTKAPGIMEMLKEQGLDRSDPQSFYTLWADYIDKVETIVDAAFEKRSCASKKKNLSKYSDKAQKLHIWGGGGEDESGVVYNMVNQPQLNSVLPQDKYTIQVWDESSGSITPSLVKQGIHQVNNI